MAMDAMEEEGDPWQNELGVLPSTGSGQVVLTPYPPLLTPESSAAAPARE